MEVFLIFTSGKARSGWRFKNWLIQGLDDAIKNPSSFHLLVVLSLELTLSSGWYQGGGSNPKGHIKMQQHQKEEKDYLFFCGFLRNKDP